VKIDVFLRRKKNNGIHSVPGDEVLKMLKSAPFYYGLHAIIRWGHWWAKATWNETLLSTM